MHIERVTNVINIDFHIKNVSVAIAGILVENVTVFNYYVPNLDLFLIALVSTSQLCIIITA